MEPKPQQELSRYERGTVRRSTRKQRERGCWLYVPAAELRAAGIDPAGPAPSYRLWGRPRGSLLVRLYR